MLHYTFTEMNAEFNEFFARYEEAATEQDLEEFMSEMTHLNADLQNALRVSLQRFVN